MVVLSDEEYNELIAKAAMDGYNKASLNDITGFILLREKKRYEFTSD